MKVGRKGIGLGFANIVAYDPYMSEVKAVALGVKRAEESPRYECRWVARLPGEASAWASPM